MPALGCVSTTMLMLMTLVLGAADDDALLERLAAANRQSSTITGSITMRTVRQDDAGTEPRVMTGTFAVQFPNRFDLVLTKPDDDEWRQRLCCDGEQRWEITQSFKDLAPDTTRTRVDDSDVELKRIFACLRFDLAALRQEFSLTAAPATAPLAVRVTLTPKPVNGTAAPGPRQIIADFDAANQLTRLVIIDAQDQRQEISFGPRAINSPLPIERFRGPVPADP